MKERTNLENSVIELARKVKKRLLNKSVDEVIIPCNCIPIANRVREYIDTESNGQIQYTYQIKLVTDKIELGSLPKSSNDTYHLIVRRRN